jgi:ubiquinone biosynthesis protein UbiJ
MAARRHSANALSEPLSSAKATPAVAFCFVLNELLSREAWARERLARFAGQAAELRPPLLPPLRLIVAEDGRVEPGGGEPMAIVTLEGVSGAGEFAEELRYLAKHLRWDFEEELSHVMGDVAAERVGATLRAFARWQFDAAQRITEALADYATAESHALVQRDELQRFAGELDRLHAAIADLEKRLV